MGSQHAQWTDPRQRCDKKLGFDGKREPGRLSEVPIALLRRASEMVMLAFAAYDQEAGPVCGHQSELEVACLARAFPCTGYGLPPCDRSCAVVPPGRADEWRTP
jgi:hypothetical protein